MAQVQFTNYQDDILSFDLRQAMLGILSPGRYCGYDTFSPGTVGGGVIGITMRHTATGIRKASKANPPVLGLQHGVVVTPQGMIIHDDNAAIPITIDDGSLNGGTTRYDVIYMDHMYLDGVPGDNPGTYEILKGTPGAGVPTLPSPAKQVALVVVTIPDGAITYEAITLTPVNCPELGGLELSDLMDAAIGSRTYTENNFIANDVSLTNSIDALDMQLKDDHDLITSVASRGLDDANWGMLADNTNHNTSQLAHGLMPKLPGPQSDQYFFNSAGAWVAPRDNWIWLDDNVAQLNSFTGGGLSYNNNGYINVETLLGDTGISEVLVELYWQRNGGNNGTALGAAMLSADVNIRDPLAIYMFIPPNDLPRAYSQSINGIVRVVNGSIYLSYVSYSGSVSDWNYPTLGNGFYIRFRAYRKVAVGLT